MAITAIPVGFVAGLFGIGGGLITVPFLFYIFGIFGIEQNFIMHLAVGTSFAIIIPTAAVSVLTHHKFKSVDFKIISHVGSPSYKSSQELAIHSQNLEVDAIATMGPSFFPPSDAESLIEFCKPIALGAKNIPFYYYHIPSISHVKVDMKSFLEKVSQSIPNLVGIKFTHNDLMEFQQCINFKNGHFEIFNGNDEALLGGLSLGAIGAVGSTYNYMPSYYYEIIDYFESGNIKEARKTQQFSVKVVEILNKYGGGVRAGKAIMEIIGIDCGPCRAPLKKITSTERNKLIEELKLINFF